jgi:hypothetical protein
MGTTRIVVVIRTEVGFLKAVTWNSWVVRLGSIGTRVDGEQRRLLVVLQLVERQLMPLIVNVMVDRLQQTTPKRPRKDINRIKQVHRLFNLHLRGEE